ncbi:MAG: ACT domain-containing protein [Chlamydiae bacterium]|nr:ACT domain-containing protein [Chlamydiota bacterium]MBI3276639.1 ACT domain-containing protein [Chlamydiota bacterium]
MMKTRQNSLVITAIGNDRCGIVAGVTQVLFEAGCNLEDSSMTLLEGEFAMILVVEMPPELDLSLLDKHFDKVRKTLGLEVVLKRMILEKSSVSLPSHMISVYGADQPGIVYKVTHLLAEKNVNITDVNTKRVDEKGASLYMMVLEVELPSGLDQDSLKKDLEVLGKNLSIKITLHPIETLTL